MEVLEIHDNAALVTLRDLGDCAPGSDRDCDALRL
jgi:hypothetical protein